MTEDNVLRLERETRSSIELKRNAKGEYAWGVKVYFADDEDLFALGRLRLIDQALREQYIKEVTA